jgi:hypothetical protein
MIWEEFPSAIRAVGQGSLLVALLGACLASPALAQNAPAGGDKEQQSRDSSAPSSDKGQDDPHANEAGSVMNMVDMNSASMYLMNLASGTSVNAAALPMPMVMTHFGSWNTTFMGVGFIVDTQQSGRCPATVVMPAL